MYIFVWLIDLLKWDFLFLLFFVERRESIFNLVYFLSTRTEDKTLTLNLFFFSFNDCIGVSDIPIKMLTESTQEKLILTSARSPSLFIHNQAVSIRKVKWESNELLMRRLREHKNIKSIQTQQYPHKIHQQHSHELSQFSKVSHIQSRLQFSARNNWIKKKRNT